MDKDLAKSAEHGLPGQCSGFPALGSATWSLRTRHTVETSFFLRPTFAPRPNPQEVKSLLDNDLDALLREVILSTAAAAQAEGFQVQVTRYQLPVSTRLHQDVHSLKLT